MEVGRRGGGAGLGAVVPNPKLKLMDQAREVLRLCYYSIRTEQAYCDWTRRYVKFHGMRTREDLLPAEPKIEMLLLMNVSRSSLPVKLPEPARLSRSTL